MKAMSPLYPISGNILNLRTWTFSVGSNADFIIMAGKFLLFYEILYLNVATISRLHTGVLTIEPEIRQAIPQSAFVDAVEEYEKDEETEDEGSGREA